MAASVISLKYSYGGVTKDIDLVDGVGLKMAPTAAFCYSDFKVKVSLNGSYSKKYRTIKQWNFGDGTIIYGNDASHSYTRPGKYMVTCQLYDITTSSIVSVLDRIYIIVKEPICTDITFDKSAENFLISKINKVGSLFASISNPLKYVPRIIPDFINSDNYDSYFDLNKASYYHLYRYYAFLELSNNASEKHFLKPINFYTPKYYAIFGYHDKNNKLLLKVYRDDVNELNDIEATLIKAIKEYIKCFNINYNFNDDIKTELEFTDMSSAENAEITFFYNASELGSHDSYLGSISFTDIWFKNDFNLVNEIDENTPIDKEHNCHLYFEFFNEDIKFPDEDFYQDSYLNLKTKYYGINFEDKTNECIEALTLNGLYTEDILNDNLVCKINDESKYIYLDKHFRMALYKDEPINLYHALYIKNENVDKSTPITYSLYKGENINLATLSFAEKDNNEESFEALEEDSAIIDGKFYKFHKFTPTKKLLQITGVKNDETYVYINDRNLKTLDSIVIPTEKQINIDLNRLLETYMPHSMFEDADNLKAMLSDVFINKTSGVNSLEYIIRKSEHFLDDNSNYRTCYIKNLIDILGMMGESVNNYNINSFEKVNEFKELLRILTMSYGDLFGQELEQRDIAIKELYKGSNVSYEIEFNDIIICNRVGKVIGTVSNNKVKPFRTTTGELKPSDYIICRNKLTNSTWLVTFNNISSSNIPNTKLKDQIISEFTKDGFSASDVEEFRYYKLSEYDKSWAWGLILPEETNIKTDKIQDLSQYYSFYMYKPPYKERKYNFIDNSTLPIDENNELISKDEWEKFLSYDCLMKMLFKAVE